MIKLTSAYGEVIVNLALMTHMESSAGGGTMIHFQDTQVWVRETLEEVYEKCLLEC